MSKAAGVLTQASLLFPESWSCCLGQKDTCEPSAAFSLASYHGSRAGGPNPGHAYQMLANAGPSAAYLYTTWSPETPLVFRSKDIFGPVLPVSLLFSVICLSCPYLAVKNSYFVDKILKKTEEHVFGRMTTFFRQSILTKKEQCFGAPGISCLKAVFVTCGLCTLDN